jgi:hypothetical protein
VFSVQRTLLLSLLIALMPLLHACGKEEHEAKSERRSEGPATGSGGAENQGQESAVLRIPVPFTPIQIIVLELFMDLAASSTFVAEPRRG